MNNTDCSSISYKIVSRQSHPRDTIINIGGVRIGSNKITVIAGPCAVENESLLIETAVKVKTAGAEILRGGAFKPRTCPYSFQGLEEDGLKMLVSAKEATGLKVVTEVMDTRNVELVAKYADIIQIGSRNMQNFALLREAGMSQKPILLKRGIAATINEFLMAAEYIAAEGNTNIILCERGIRTFETSVRYTLDISAVPILKELSHLPVIVDPSHSSGNWKYVCPLSKAAVAAGADGLILEVHPYPHTALCDGQQSLKPELFEQLMIELKSIASSISREI